MGEPETVLISLLRAELCAEPLRDDLKAQITPELLPQLYEISVRHHLAHLVSDVLWKNGLLPAENETAEKFRTMQLRAVYHVGLLDQAFGEISRSFETAGISYLPLKGSVMRSLWREPWMRTSCDIDILIHHADLKRATALLTGAPQYKQMEMNSHDVLFLSPKGVHLELHYGVEEKCAANSMAVLSQIWDHASAGEGVCRHDLDDEMFYFYHIAHMAKHLEHGGCGIRPFLDLWLLNHKREYDDQKRARLIAEGGLTQFERAAVQLSEVWLSDAEPDDLCMQLADYTLRGGVYGTMANMLEVERRTKSRTGYFWSRLFLPYDSLKYTYPILQKHRFLLPVMELQRLAKLFNRNSRNRAVRELRYENGITDDRRRAMADFLERLGL